MMMLFRCSSRCKTAFNDLMSCLNMANAVLMCKIGVKYKYSSAAVCAYTCFFFFFGNEQGVSLLDHVL